MDYHRHLCNDANHARAVDRDCFHDRHCSEIDFDADAGNCGVARIAGAADVVHPLVAFHGSVEEPHRIGMAWNFDARPVLVVAERFWLFGDRHGCLPWIVLAPLDLEILEVN